MKRKKTFNFILLIIVTGLVLYFSLKDNFEVTINEIRNINCVWLLVAIFFIVMYWIFRTMSLHRFILIFKKDFKFLSTFRLVMTTVFFDGVTPFASGGQPFQVYYLKKHGVDVLDGTNIAIQNFIVYQVALVLLGLLALMFNMIFKVFPDTSMIKSLVSLGFLINLIVTILLFSIAFLKGFNKFICKHVIKILNKMKIIKDKDETIKKFNEYVNNFNKGAKELIKNKKFFMQGIFYNFAALCSFYIIPVILLFATGDYTSFNVFLAIIASAYVMLIGSFVPIPGGSGGLEYAFIAFFGYFITGPKLTALMLLWRFVTYYLGIIVGAIVMNIKERSN